MQIEKLRKRLLNAGKTTTEYRMTVAEAKALLTEIDLLKKQLEEAVRPIVQVVEHRVESTPRILDGGTLG